MSLALFVVFFATGLRTPLLALLALRRLRNVAQVALPYAPGLLLIPLVAPWLAEPDRVGLVAVAIAPGLLSAPALATAMGGRMDRAGALLLGTIGASFILTVLRGGAGTGALQNAMFAFVLGAGATSLVPMLPEMVRTIVQRAGDVGFSAVLLIAIAGGPSLGAAAALAAVALFVATAGTALLVARIAGVDTRSAIAASGTRDPAVAAALAVAVGGPGAAGVPLYSAAVLLGLAALLVALNRRKAR